MNKLTFFLLFSFLQLTFFALLPHRGQGGLYAQKTEGMITYERKSSWTKMYSRLTYLSKDEIERLKSTYGKDDEWTTKTKLYFNLKESLYTHFNEVGESEDGTYSYRQDDLILYRNFEQEKKTDIIETLGKTYVIEDSLPPIKWKVMNQIKDVAGYICMKAITEDTIKNQTITVWFAQDLALPTGPENYYGLPGTIMEVDINDGAVVMTATQVEFKKLEKELTLPKKIKGKRIKNKDYISLIFNHIKDSITAQRSPFNWGGLRY